MFSAKPLLEMPRWEAAAVAAIIVALMGYAIIWLEWVPHMAILTAMVSLLVYGLCRGVRYRAMQDWMIGAVGQGMGALYLFFFIGLLVTALMISGAIPTLMYYGFGLISPGYFYFSAFALSSVIGISLGSSLTTCATVGMAFMGMAHAFHADLAMTAGAIVSGAFFGDKMSPLSDTTNLAPAVTSTDLFSHIRNMMATAVPAMLTAAALFWLLGQSYAGQALHAERVEAIMAALEGQFAFHPLLLLPALLVLVLAVRRFPALPTLFFGVLAGAVTAYLGQGASVPEISAAMQDGFSSATGVEAVDELLSKGGIQSMMWTISLVLIALGFGGILEQTRCLEVLLNAIVRRVRGRLSLVAASTGGSVGTNLVTGDPYLAVALPGRMFGPVYRGRGLSMLNLSRSIEEGGTLINPLVPWSAGGAFTAGALGIPTLAYAPFAVACWLSPLIGLLYAGLGWFSPRASAAERDRWRAEGEPVLLAGEMVNAAQLDPEELERDFDTYRRR